MALKPRPASKRKHNALSVPSRKKLKVRHENADSLPWKSIARPTEASMGFEDGILELEEVEGVDVVFEETEGGRIVRFDVCLFLLATILLY